MTEQRNEIWNRFAIVEHSSWSPFWTLSLVPDLQRVHSFISTVIPVVHSNAVTNWRIELNISKTPSSIGNLKKINKFNTKQNLTWQPWSIFPELSGTLRSWHLWVLLVVLIGYSSSLLLFFTLDCRCSWSSQFLARHLYNDGQSVHPYIQRSFERKAPKPWSRQCFFCHVPFIFFKLRVQWVKNGPRKFIQDPLTS